MMFFRRYVVVAVCWGLASCAAAPASRHRTPDPRRAVGAPGVVPVQDSLFMDEAEVANLHWLEYLHFIRRDSSTDFYVSQLPDSTAQPPVRPGKKTGVGPPDTAAVSYLRYPGFRYYPVVGVSYEQARNYCQWRTNTVRQLIRAAPPARPGQSTYYTRHRKLLARYDVTATYRLPTPAEWELAAHGTVSSDPKLAEVYAGTPSMLGLHHMAGNVAELTATPTVVKGGSWFRSDVPLDVNLPNPGPRPWLGFRCACVVEARAKPALAR